MVNMIYGRAGSGKTARVCELAAASVSSGRKVFFIVPEQMAVDTEARMTSLLDGKSTLSLEILNFKRLCNRVFREHGGLSYNYITKSGRLLMMWQTLTDLAPLLNSSESIDRGTVSRMLAAINEFKTYRITPPMLERAAGKLSDDAAHKKLTDKLSDLSLIFAAYTNLVAEVCDDASDDLTKAAELLRESDLFRGADVYFDSFNGYTPQEIGVIRQIMRSAENVTFSLCLDTVPERSAEELFVNQRSTAMSLKRLADELCQNVTEDVLTNNYRSKHPELKFLESYLWSLELTKDVGYRDDAPHLQLIECQSLFSECEAVAVDILRKVRSGAMWKDFTVVTRGLERYDGILDVTFEKYGIPHFASKRTDIKTRPLIKLILAALSLKHTNFRTSDVISYIKTGLCPLTPDEISELENYAELWRIRGAARWSTDFLMNPSGYTAEFTEEAALKLERINDIRERVILPLTDLHTALSNETDVRGYSRVLYNFLVNLGIPERLSVIAAAEREYDPAAAQETEQLFSILIDAFDELCTVMPELPVDTPTYTELLKIIFDETDIGRIPGTVDEVVSGDASLIRASGKHIYIIGANEGLFPLAPKSDGIFSDTDRDRLADIGVVLSGGTDYRSADERFAFYRAVASARESLTVIWSGSDLSGHSMKPSFGALRICSLFPGKKVISYSDLPLLERMEGRDNLLEYIAEADTSDDTKELALALRQLALEDPSLSSRISKLSMPLIDSETILEPNCARMLAGGDLALTQSRLDSYVLCHFSYFCKYILKLEEHKAAKFDATDIGTFIHHILEEFISQAEENGELSKITDSEIERMIDDIIADYMQTICRISPDLSGSRLAHMFARLKRSSRLLCKNLVSEFSQSRFRPAFFELPIRFGENDRKSVDPLRVKLHDGTYAYIYGVADRVDILEHEDKLYVRVVDYKTGSKDFSLEDVSIGLNMQMLLYLFSIWKNGGKSGNALEFAKNCEIVPAGILYFKAGVPTVSLDVHTPPEEVERIASEGLTRKGLLLDDPDILAAMDKELTGAYLPIKQKKDGSFTNPDALTSIESFASLLASMETTIKEIGKEIKRGNASAKPLKTKEHDACAYCEMRPICRKNV